jgi:hypothetical protein
VVPIGEMVTLIYRTMRVSQLEDTGVEGAAALLPQLHTEMLRLLAALAASLGRRLLPFASTLGNLLRIAIARPCSTLLGRSSAVRHSAYLAAQHCMDALGSGMADAFALPLLPDLLAVIEGGMSEHDAQAGKAAQFVGEDYTVEALSSPGPGSGRKARRASNQAAKRGGQSGGRQGKDGGVSVAKLRQLSRGGSEIYIWATRLLLQLLEGCGTLFDGAARLEIDRALVGWLSGLYTSTAGGGGGESGAAGGVMMPALAHGDARVALYGALSVSLQTPVGTGMGNTAGDHGHSGAGNHASMGGDSINIVPNLHPVRTELRVAVRTHF